MESFWQDVRFGFRILLRNPGFALAAVLALGLGIGANVAIFSVLDAVALTPLPYPEPDRLVMLWASKRTDGLDHERMSPVDFLDYRAMKDTFVDAAAWWRPEVNLTDDEGQPVRANTIEVSSNFFSVMGVQPQIGAGFSAGEELHSAEREVVISHSLWVSRYGGEEGVVGKIVQLDARAYRVVGVMPEGFHYPDKTDVWQRLTWNLAGHSRAAHFMESVARLRPGVSLRQANQALENAAANLATEFASTNKDWSAFAVRLQDEVVGSYQVSLLVLFGAVGLLLLLACSNVANLLLARASSRAREVAVRKAIGAGGFRLLRQFLTESLLLGLSGSALGLVTGVAGLRLLKAITPLDVPRLQEASINGSVLLFSLAVGLATTLLFGVAPAWQLVRTKTRQALVEGGRTGTGSVRGVRLRSLLVAGEVALAAMLLVGAGLLIRSFGALLKEDPGFLPRSSITLNLQLPRSYAKWSQVSQFYSQLLDSLRARPGIEGVGATGFLPLDTAWRVNFAVQGRPPLKREEEPICQYQTVTPGYFETIGVPLLRGRPLEDTDNADSPPVVLINERMARLYWPDEDPIGQTVVTRTRFFGPLGATLMEGMDFQVVGIVADSKNNSLKRAAEPALYFTHRQFPYNGMNLVVRGRGDSTALSALVRGEIRRLDPGLAVSNIRPLGDILRGARAEPRFLALLMGVFAAAALSLAAIGVYGVLAYAVSQRRQEIGIRMALGARPSHVIRMVVAQGLKLTFAGLLVGLAGAALLSRLIGGLLFKIEAGDGLTWVAVLVVTLVVSILACYAPARKASAVDCISAIRAD